MKRGIAPFVWIFAMVAGAIVMIFIIKFAFSHAALKTTQFSYEDISNFEINLDIITQSSSLETRITLPEIEFPCIASRQIIMTGKAQKQTEKIIFSKPQKGSTVIRAKQFSYPYPITHVYFFSPKPFSEQDINLTANLLPLSQEFYTDSQHAECIKQRLLGQIILISDIYIQKSALLRRQSQDLCRQEYNELITLMQSHKDNPTQNTAEQINNLNNELILNNCPALW